MCITYKLLMTVKSSQIDGWTVVYQQPGHVFIDHNKVCSEMLTVCSCNV